MTFVVTDSLSSNVKLAKIVSVVLVLEPALPNGTALVPTKCIQTLSH